MASLTITIPLPICTANTGFLVEYRLQGATPWTTWGIEDNSPFTITGLTEGVYYEVQISFILSKDPFVVCDPVIKTFFIPAALPCVSIIAGLEYQEGICVLLIDFTFPSPLVEPCGGYHLQYGILPNLIDVYYSTLITTPSIIPLTIPVPNGNYYVAIYAIDCAGNESLCDEDEVPAIGGCVHAEVLNATMSLINGVYYVTLSVQPSVPASIFYGISYAQSNAVNTGIPDPGGTLIFTGTGSNPETFIFPVIPNTDIIPINGSYTLKYDGGISDRCNWLTKFSASLNLT